MKEIRKFIESMQQRQNELYKEKHFCTEHKFEKEAEYIQTKIDVLFSIKMQLEMVADGHSKGDDVNLRF